MEGETSITNQIKLAYKEITKWKKNIFSLPRGKSGMDFLTRSLLDYCISLWIKTKWERIALSLVNIFIPLMMQKPSQRSKACDHTKYLSARHEKWKADGRDTEKDS